MFRSLVSHCVTQTGECDERPKSDRAFQIGSPSRLEFDTERSNAQSSPFSGVIGSRPESDGGSAVVTLAQTGGVSKP